MCSLFSTFAFADVDTCPYSKEEPPVYYFPMTHFNEHSEDGIENAWSSQLEIYHALKELLLVKSNLAIFHEEAFFSNKEDYTARMRGIIQVRMENLESEESKVALKNAAEELETHNFHYLSLSEESKDLFMQMRIPLSRFKLIGDVFTEIIRERLLLVFPKPLEKDEILKDEQKTMLGTWGALPILAAHDLALNIQKTEDYEISEKMCSPEAREDFGTFATIGFNLREASVVDLMQSYHQKNPSDDRALIYGALHDFVKFFDKVEVPIAWPDRDATDLDRARPLLWLWQNLDSRCN